MVAAVVAAVDAAVADEAAAEVAAADVDQAVSAATGTAAADRAINNRQSPGTFKTLRRRNNDMLREGPAD